MFCTRRHRLVASDWTPLSGCITHEGKRVLVCTHMVDDPDARTTDGIWLREEEVQLLPRSLAPAHEEFDPWRSQVRV
jgi:hypothetical protein